MKFAVFFYALVGLSLSAFASQGATVIGEYELNGKIVKKCIDLPSDRSAELQIQLFLDTGAKHAYEISGSCSVNGFPGSKKTESSKAELFNLCREVTPYWYNDNGDCVSRIQMALKRGVSHEDIVACTVTINGTLAVLPNGLRNFTACVDGL